MDGPSLPGITTSVLALGIVTVLAWTLRDRSRNRLPLPPGPKPFPLIGNVLDMPREKEWETYERWSRQYGDVMHISLLGQHVVILNSVKAVTDLFERRSALYSSRPQSTMASELMGFGAWNFGLQEYGDKWRQGRRLFHSGVHQGVIPKYQSVQIRNARAFLKQLKENSDELHTTVRKNAGSTIVDVVYGIDRERNSHLIAITDETLHQFNLATVPGAFMVDLIPALRFLPRWFPGASFHKIAERTQQLAEEMRQTPMLEVKKAMLAGNVKSSMTTQLLGAVADGSGEVNESDVVDVTGIAYGAGADTVGLLQKLVDTTKSSSQTVSSILTFFIAMCHYPKVQAKAQAELLAVVGTDRLPDFGDQINLPYINAIVLEVLRWKPVTNLGFPHSTIADDEYDGFFIPKGSIVIGNIRSILHNPEEYPEPDVFRPERFLKHMHDGTYELDKNIRSPQTVAFGFGRRICPGRHLAQQSLFAVMASILAAFSITPKIDEFGIPQLPQLDTILSGGLISHPLPFKCSIKPRSTRAAELIDQSLPERGL